MKTFMLRILLCASVALSLVLAGCGPKEIEPYQSTKEINSSEEALDYSSGYAATHDQNGVLRGQPGFISEENLEDGAGINIVGHNRGTYIDENGNIISLEDIPGVQGQGSGYGSVADSSGSGSGSAAGSSRFGSTGSSGAGSGSAAGSSRFGSTGSSGAGSGSAAGSSRFGSTGSSGAGSGSAAGSSRFGSTGSSGVDFDPNTPIVESLTAGSGAGEVTSTFAEEQAQDHQTDAYKKKHGRSSSQMESVYFDFDQSTIRSNQIPHIEHNGDYLKTNLASKVVVEGNCDEKGTKEYNLALGERRAMNAKQYLIDLGVERSRIRTISYGEERLLFTGSNKSAYNRRVDFMLE